MRRTVWVLLGASLLPAVLFGQEKGKKLEPCSLLTAADAATIMGSPMSLVDRGKNNCTYGVLGKGMTTAVGRGREVIRDVTFGMKEYKNAEARDKEWASMTKRVHDPENKENTQVLSGIGDEAYLVNYTKGGKMVGGLSLVYVRKGMVAFSLSVFDKNQASSGEGATAVAKKIADQL